jgi:hypothetical protein
MMAMSFTASWDSLTKVISAVVVVLLLGPAIFVLRSPLASGIGILVLVLAYAWSARGYQIIDGTLRIRRLAGSVRIPLESIREARQATPEDLSGCVRLFGSGGLFGWYGLFRTSKLGKSTWYVTDRSHAVVLVTPEKTLLISPDEVERFLGVVRLTVPEPPPTAPALHALGSYHSGNRGALVGAITAVVALAIAALALLYAPGPPAYTLTPETLTIHDRFYPVTVNASTVDVSGVRVVDLTTDKEWQPTMRTNGFGSLHYHAGWFRVAGGKSVRMYRADSKQLVLLPPAGDGSAVLLETRDPAQLAREVREKWSRRQNPVVVSPL